MHPNGFKDLIQTTVIIHRIRHFFRMLKAKGSHDTDEWDRVRAAARVFPLGDVLRIMCPVAKFPLVHVAETIPYRINTC